MNTMKIPGFTAEASLYQISGQYHAANQPEQASGIVHPAIGHFTPLSLAESTRQTGGPLLDFCTWVCTCLLGTLLNTSVYGLHLLQRHATVCRPSFVRNKANPGRVGKQLYRLPTINESFKVGQKNLAIPHV
ncbi:MAG: hypothetical protein WC856_08500 [Methylococcaceae bacterium]|jgi:hypothetical protein